MYDFSTSSIIISRVPVAERGTMKTVLLHALLLILAAGASHSARILGIIPTPSISHQLPFRLIALELAKRGHQVTLITTDPVKKNVQNYTEIDMSFTYDYWRAAFDFTSMSEASPVVMMDMMTAAGKRICELQLGSSQMKEFLTARPSFDVVILEHLMYQCYFGLVHKLGSPPLVGFVSLGVPSPIHPSYGNPNNPAYCPDLMLGYSDHMSFWERMYNTYIILRLNYIFQYVMQPVQDEVMRTYFGDEPPSVFETETNFSLILVNNHFSMNYPRPMLPNMIELTGLHIEKQRKPLPKDIQNFLDGAENGVIYFSLGTNVRGSTMPEHKRRAFLEAFSQLPQRVLWKWEADDLPGRPENVKISKWLPQQDVLAHRNIKLFITQGGLQSMNEAGYFGVPLIGIPFMGDQQNNVAKMVQAGIGYRLEFKDVTTASVLHAVRTVLGDQSYRENMKRFSAVYREHQEASLDTAVWWVEYVIRHKGARHMRSAALDLSWWQLMLLDVIAFVAATAGFAAFIAYKAVSYVARALSLSRKLKSS